MKAENHWEVGNIVEVAFAFVDKNGAAIDPAVVRFKYRRPDTGVVTTLTYGTDGALVKDSTGVYHVDVTADAPGAWLYRAESTGVGQAAIEGGFYADPTRVM